MRAVFWELEDGFSKEGSGPYLGKKEGMHKGLDLRSMSRLKSVSS